MYEQLKRIGALLTGLFEALPEQARNGVPVLVVLVLLDTLMGFWIAARCADARSEKIRSGLVPKVLQYAALISMGWGIGKIAHVGLIAPAVVACCFIEGFSVLENTVLLEQCGGAPLGPARPLIKRLQTIMAAGAPQKGNSE